MQGIKTKQQLLLELVKIQNELEGKVKIHDNMIKKFMKMVEHDEVFSQIINQFPYPIAVFKSMGTLIMANQALLEYACISSKDIEEGKCNIEQINKLSNQKLTTEYKKAFAGETLLLKDLKNAFSNAVLFPVYPNKGSVTYGVVIFLN